MFKTSILFTALLSAAALTSVSAAPVQTEGTGIGKHGDIKLAVTFDNGKIQDIKVLEDHENKVLAAKASQISKMPLSPTTPLRSTVLPARLSPLKVS